MEPQSLDVPPAIDAVAEPVTPASEKEAKPYPLPEVELPLLNAVKALGLVTPSSLEVATKATSPSLEFWIVGIVTAGLTLAPAATPLWSTVSPAASCTTSTMIGSPLSPEVKFTVTDPFVVPLPTPCQANMVSLPPRTASEVIAFASPERAE